MLLCKIKIYFLYLVSYESIFRSSEVAPFYVNGKLCRNVVVLRVFPSMPVESVKSIFKNYS